MIEGGFNVLKGSVILAVALLLVPISGAAQAPLTRAQFEQWLRDVHRSAELYAAGDTAGALALLDKEKVPPQRHRDLAEVIFLDLQHPAAEPKVHPVWTMRLVRALAALHMEGALDAYNRKKEEGFGDHIALAEHLFANIARLEMRPDAAPAWELAIGLIAVTEGRLPWAQSFLEAACKQYPDDASLLLACGSVHEAVAMLPADVLARWPARLDGSRSQLRARDTVTIVPGLDIGGLLTAGAVAARTAHAREVETAAKVLERALQVDPSSVEAHLRLAHVLAMKGKDKEAAVLFERLLSGTLKTDTRTRYLAGLFLGAIQLRAKDFDRAAVTLRTASERIPTAQSALIALAFVMHSRGEGDQSADMLEHAVQPSDDVTDPWWGYRFAQYWIIKPLLATLRKDVSR